MSWQILQGDALERLKDLPEKSVQTCITSPPYFGLRDYGTAEWDGGDEGCDHSRHKDYGEKSDTNRGSIRGGPMGQVCDKCGATRQDSQIGLEPTPDEYVQSLVEVFREVRRVLRDDGTLWLNLAPSYASGDIRPSQSRPGAPAYGSGGKARADSPGPGSAYRGLCDGCLADFRSHRDRIEHTRQPHGLAPQHDEQIGRDNGRRGSEPVAPDASPLDAQESTTLESWLRLRGECSRCDSRVSALSGLGSDEHDARASARSSDYSDDTVPPSRTLAGRIEDTEPSVLAWGDYTSTLKPKDLIPTPWMVAMALQADGWYLRAEIIWAKPNPMPESVRDRPTRAHEQVFLLSKNPRYYWDADAIREDNSPLRPDRVGLVKRSSPKNLDTREGGGNGQNPDSEVPYGEGGRNKRSVWTVTTRPYAEAHFATFPPSLIEPMVLAGSSPQACGECGAPWERVTERERTTYDGRQATTPGRDSEGAHANHLSMERNMAVLVQTKGWQPTCTHTDDTGSSVVLDPFNGAGTTGVVALRHDRSYIGIELNPDYCELSRNRIREDGPLFNVASEAA